VRRRLVIAGIGGAAAAWPFSGRGQPAEVPTVGVLVIGSSSSVRFWDIFRKALNDLGYIEGRTVRFELRVDDGPVSRLSELAAELVRRNVDVIVPLFTAPAVAAKQATRDIPIVMVGPGDPVASGLIESLDRPGGNVTGTTSMEPDLAGRCLKLAQQLLPAVGRAAVLVDATSPFSQSFLRKIQLAGKAAAIVIDPLMAHGYPEIDEAFATMKRTRPDALIVQPSLPMRYVAELALASGLPSASPYRVFAEEGGLISYWLEESDLFRRCAQIVAQVLKGKRPTDIPVEQPTKFELVLNRRTAKVLGLAVPPAFLDRVDSMIE
jgi:putative tryptophan/tyrosine transport system substrate-binding protein